MMIKSSFLLILLSAGLSLQIFVAEARAEWTFHPGISLRESYDDNILLTPDNEKEDYITEIKPNINLLFKGNRLDLSLNGGGDFLFYAKNSDQNEQHLTGALTSKLSILRDTLFLRLDDTFQRVTVDQRRQTTVDSSLVNMTDQNRLTVNPYLELPLSSKIKFNSGYTYENLSYWSGAGDDTQNHTLMTGITAQLTEKIEATVSYSYLFHRPTLNPEYDRQDPSCGLKFQVTPKLALSGTIGETFFHYINSFKHDFSSLIWSAKGDYRLTESLSFNGGYEVNFYDSVDQGTYKNESATAGIKYDGFVPVTIVFSSNDEKYLSLDREDRNYGVRADAAFPLAAKLKLKILGMYTNYKFTPVTERADRYNAQATIEYALKITTLSLGYTYNMNDSSIDAHDYRDNIVFIQAKSEF